MDIDHVQGWQRAACALACVIAFTASAVAGELRGAPARDEAGDRRAGQAATFGAPLREGELDRLRGGDGSDASTTTVGVDNRGEVGGNSATDVVSGSNHVEGGAFANAAGLSTVIQNSGSNVLIQNGTAINIQFNGTGP